MRRVLAGLLLSAFMTGTGWAQQGGVWVQVEAQPTLAGAQDRVRAYAGELEHVAGYYLASGWYAIALGPYTERDAQTLLGRLRDERAIPGDSFIVTGGQFRQQFWPIGAGAPTTPQPLPGAAAPTAEAEAEPETPTLEEQIAEALDPAAADAPAVEAAPEPEPEETIYEAQASEAALSLPQKEQLQVALQWAGFYSSTIDGLFGRGTRTSMAAWQAENGYEATGILTTRQRAALLSAYNAVLEGMDLRTVRDDTAGISITLPTGAVEFSRYDPPFARFDASAEVPAQVLLISQEGDQDRLWGLYEIMQTLEIVPPEGPREKSATSFTIEGVGPELQSYTYATLDAGAIKGFTLVWPADDTERFSRILAEMKASFTPIEGVLDPRIAPPDENQAIDLVSGLAIRKPERTRSGFYVDGRGTVLTTTDAVADCREVTIDSDHQATVAFRDEALGLAVLTPQDALAPLAVARFQTGVPLLRSDVAVAGYPYGDALAAPAVTFGQLEDIRGLNGEEEIKRLSLSAQPGDAGGPVFDAGGAVLGMLLPRDRNGGTVLPADVGFSVDADAIMAALSEAGVTPETTDRIASITPELLSRRAADVTVLVSCWD